IFYDFSGYSDMAIGLGRFMGFNIPQNFNSPYLSASFSEFWRRWHMSLSYWLRDFLYIPLGGSKKGRFRTYVNLIITMFLGGLWHGAAWTFIVWGLWHGALLAIERALGDRNPIRKAPRVVQILFTNFFVMIGWAFFRAASLGEAGKVIRGLFGFGGEGAASAFMKAPGFLAAAALAVLLIIKGENIYERKWRFNAATCVFIIALFAVCAVLVLSQDFSPFLYFQF
ncbi:MAG TPA: MBOAT family O-acyltransferase, partial [bacterium]|nr:MBOAT family O-acyltransferase [bacterium]